jgi:hypothetical protein
MATSMTPGSYTPAGRKAELDLRLVQERELIEKWLCTTYRMKAPVANVIAQQHYLGGPLLNLTKGVIS